MASACRKVISYPKSGVKHRLCNRGRIHRPTRSIIPADGRTVISGFRTFAAHLIEAIALSVAFVSPLLNKTARIIVSSPLALVMNDVAVSE